MEHLLGLPSPWRTRALAAGAIALLELVILLGIGLAFLGTSVSTHVTRAAQAKALEPAAPEHKAPRKAKKKVIAPKLIARGETSVLVLNGNGTTGAAHSEAAQVQSLGYVIGGVGNAPRRDYTHTLVMYRKGFRAEALRLAHDRHIPIVTPLDGLRASELMGAHLALVLGA